jgi:hypothetical protein
MKKSNENFYLKKNISRNGLCPVMGRITIGNDMVQFSYKLDADTALWDTRAGRVTPFILPHLELIGEAFLISFSQFKG